MLSEPRWDRRLTHKRQPVWNKLENKNRLCSVSASRSRFVHVEETIHFPTSSSWGPVGGLSREKIVLFVFGHIKHKDHNNSDNTTSSLPEAQGTLRLTCRLYVDPGVSYRCRGRRSIDSRTAISLRIKATAGRLQTQKQVKLFLLSVHGSDRFNLTLTPNYNKLHKHQKVLVPGERVQIQHDYSCVTLQTIK